MGYESGAAGTVFGFSDGCATAGAAVLSTNAKTTRIEITLEDLIRLSFLTCAVIKEHQK
jgi:hypothetical protein